MPVRVKGKTAQRIKAWSFSRYSDYVLCPFKAFLKHVKRVQEPPNAAMQRGSEIHDKAENYIMGKISRIPSELKEFHKLFKQLRDDYKKNKDIVVEQMWAFTKDWKVTRWDDWAKCVVRIKVDCAVVVSSDTMIVYDWKTGKFRPQQNQKYNEQLELYALGALLIFPHIKTVYPQLVYVDEGVTYEGEDDNPLKFTKDQVPALKKSWEKRTKAMLNDTQFAPKPNNLCRWCYFRADNGGPCQY